MSVFDLRVPLWERMAYHGTGWVLDLTMWLYCRWNIMDERNPLGWRIVARRYGLCDRLIPGAAGVDWRRRHG